MINLMDSKENELYEIIWNVNDGVSFELTKAEGLIMGATIMLLKKYKHYLLIRIDNKRVLLDSEVASKIKVRA